MSQRLQLLNGIRQLIVKFATDEGIVLAEQFPSPESFNQFVISFSIKLVQETLEVSIREAFDIVMGDGEFNAMANSIYGELTAK